MSALSLHQRWDPHLDASHFQPWKREDVATHRREAAGATGAGRLELVGRERISDPEAGTQEEE